MLLVNDNEVMINHFPDGTQKLDCFLSLNQNCDCVWIKWRYQSDEELVTLMFVVKHLRNNGFSNKEFILVMDYIPNARMDRVYKTHEVFTLKYFCEIINSLNFYRVIVTDPHSNVSEALLNSVIINSPRTIINDVIRKMDVAENLLLFFPDNGAVKRYATMFPKYKYIYGNKIRRWEDGVILGTEIVNPFNVQIEGKNVLIIDDICSRGTTFLKSAEALAKYNPKSVDLYITHCENTILEGEVLTSGYVNRVYTTNSLFTESHEKITVMEV